MKKHVFVLFSLVVISALSLHYVVQGQNIGGYSGSTFQSSVNVTQLPAAASANNGVIYLVKDGASLTDCASGGGSIQVMCASNGSVWAAVGGAGLCASGNQCGLSGGALTLGASGSAGSLTIYSGTSTANTQITSTGAGAVLSHGNSLGSAGPQESFATGTSTSSSGTAVGFRLVPVYNQTSVAGATDFLINRTETGIGSGAQSFFVGQVGGTTKLLIDHNGVIQNSGAQPTRTGSCNSSTPLGGATSGSFVGTSNPCTSGTYILTFPFTATNLWFCTLFDATTTADTFVLTSRTNTACTFTGSSVASDVLVFTATPY